MPSCMAKQRREVRSPLEQCDREEEIVQWLARHGLDTANAQMLADTEVTFEALGCASCRCGPTALECGGAVGSRRLCSCGT